MKIWILIVLGFFAATLLTGCQGGIDEGALAGSRGLGSSDEVDDTPDCPPPDGVGTVAPGISIASIVFTVNGARQRVQDGESLQAQPGDEVRVQEVTLCVGSFSADGGQACLDVVPTTAGDQDVGSEHKGSHMFAISPGSMTITNLDFGWTVREDWEGLSAVLNHWTPTTTQDLACASGGCERDDWMTIAFE